MKLEKLKVKSFATALDAGKKARLQGGLEQQVNRASSCIEPDCPCF